MMLFYLQGRSQTVYHSKQSIEYDWCDSTLTFVEDFRYFEKALITFSEAMDSVSIVGDTEDFIRLTLAEITKNHVSFDGNDEFGYNYGIILDYRRNQLKIHGKIDKKPYLIVIEIVEKLKRIE